MGSGLQVDRLRKVTSRHNGAVKALRQAFHDAEPTADGFIAIEGTRLIDEAVRSGLRFKTVFFSESGAERADRVIKQMRASVETLVLADDVFAGAVSTASPQGVAAFVALKPASLAQIMRLPDPLLMVLAGLQDPGNLGTILRVAEAFGAAGVILTENTVSPFNAKAVRASAGSLFRLPVVRTSFAEMAPALRAASIRLVGTTSKQGTALPAADLTLGSAIVVGNEGAGLPREVLAAVQELITIPHTPQVESLNAGIAAALVLYEAWRQRQ